MKSSLFLVADFFWVDSSPPSPSPCLTVAAVKDFFLRIPNFEIRIEHIVCRYEEYDEAVYECNKVLEIKVRDGVKNLSRGGVR